MSEYHIPIPGLEESDKIIIFTRKHWAAFLATLLIMIFAAFLPWVLLFISNFSQGEFLAGGGSVIVILMGVFYLIWAGVSLVLWISFYCDFIVVTERSIFSVKQEGIFDRQITEISLLRVQEGNSEIKGFLGTIFAYGSVVIQTASEKEKAIFENLPNPYEINQKILHLHENLVRSENVDSAAGMGEGEVAKKYEEIMEKKQDEKKKDLEEGRIVEL